MSRAESSSRHVPSYKTDSLQGKLHHHVVEPVSQTLAPATRLIKSAASPLKELGREVYNSLTHEGAIKKRASSIEALQKRFAQNAEQGVVLLKRGLELIQDLDKPSLQWPGIDEADLHVEKAVYKAMDKAVQDYLSDLQGWMPDTSLGEVKKQSAEHLRSVLQDLMAGYLFHKNETLFHAEGKAMDKEKEKRQRRGVASMLLGHHVHMGTGEGKSTVVLPIVSLVESRTSKQKDVILSSASDQGIAELKGHVERLEKELPLASGCTLTTYEYELEKQDKDSEELKELQKEMQRETILHGQYPDHLKKKIRNLYWKNRMKSMMAPSRTDMSVNKTGKSRILFATERDIVFAYEEDPKKFVKQAPTILMDEADIPYRRQTPYVTTTEAQYYTPEEIRGSMGTWLMYYIINDRIHYPTKTEAGDFTPTQHGFKLTEDAQKRLGRLNLRTLVDRPGNNSGLEHAFKKGVQIIAEGLGMANNEEIVLLEKQMRKWLRQTLPSSKLAPQEEGVQIPEGERLTEMRQVVEATAEELGAQYFQKGVGYLMEEGSSEVKIRDAYIDDLLEGHRHEPAVAIAILAMSGKYSFIPPYRTAGRSVHFQTFLSDMKSKIRCASGSLLYPDLLTGEIKKDPFASFLEKATGKEVVLISPPDRKKAPAPVLLKTQGEAMDKLVQDTVARQQPRLVICYDRLEGQALFERFSANDPNKKIVYMPIHPTPEEVSLYCRDLAEGRIDILISAGNLGFGVNIVQATGEFPNLHVSLYGLPENQLQIVQALGRRRREGNDFSWYISEPAIYRYIADFKDETTWRERFIQGYVSVKQMLAGYEEVLQDPEKGLQYVVDLLHQHEVQRRSDDIFVTYFDQSMDKIRKFAFGHLRELISKEYKKKENKVKEAHILHALKTQAAAMSEFFEGPYPRNSDPKLADLERQVRWMEKNTGTLMSQYGLPDSLDEYVEHELAVAGGSMQAHNMKDLLENKLLTHLFGTLGKPSLIEQYVEEWYEQRKSGMQDMTRVLSDNYRLQRMLPVVMRSARGEIAPHAPAPAIRIRLEAAFQPLASPVQTDASLRGVTIGTFNIGNQRILGLRNEQGELMLLNSYQPAKEKFDWEVGDITGRIGLNLLSSPIGNTGNQGEHTYFLWTSKQ